MVCKVILVKPQQLYRVLSQCRASANIVMLSIYYLMNYIWTTIVIISTILMTTWGKADFLACAIDGVGSAFATTVSLMAVYCVWNGIFELLEQCGALKVLSRWLQPIVKLLFGVSKDSKATEYITINMSANLLGVSNASTPSAVKAMSLLEGDNKQLSYSGAMLFVFNACGVQLMPSTAMGIRASLGSNSAYDTMLPTLLSSVITVIVGMLLVRIAYLRKGKEK